MWKKTENSSPSGEQTNGDAEAETTESEGLSSPDYFTQCIEGALGAIKVAAFHANNQSDPAGLLAVAEAYAGMWTMMNENGHFDEEEEVEIGFKPNGK